MLDFIEHILELTIKIVWWNNLGVFFRIIDILIEVSGVLLYITKQVTQVTIMLFPNISLDFSSSGFKF